MKIKIKEVVVFSEDHPIHATIKEDLKGYEIDYFGFDYPTGYAGNLEDAQNYALKILSVAEQNCGIKNMTGK